MKTTEQILDIVNELKSLIAKCDEFKADNDTEALEAAFEDYSINFNDFENINEDDYPNAELFDSLNGFYHEAVDKYYEYKLRLKYGW